METSPAAGRVSVGVRLGSDDEPRRSRRYATDVVLAMCEPRERDRYLDVGTGGGALLDVIEPHVGWSAATDHRRGALRTFARRHATGPALARPAHLPFADASFSLVTFGAGFRRLREPEAAVAEAARILRPGGRYLVVDVPGPENQARRAARDLVERARDRRHVGIVPPSQAREIISGFGFQLAAEERLVEDRRDDEWARGDGASLERIRSALWRLRPLAGGFLALRWEADGFVFRRERTYYLGVRR